jgi:hypothetical protein
MLKQLIEKRSALFADLDKIRNQRENEKREYTEKEHTDVNDLLLKIDDNEKQIQLESKIAEKRNMKLDGIAAQDANVNISNNKDYVQEFRNLALQGQGKMTVPYNSIQKRTTITTTSNAAFKYTDQVAGLSIDNGELVLDSLGASKTYYFESGSQAFPSITSIEAAFASAEGTSVADRTLTSASKTLNPTFVSASIEVTKTFLASSKPENIADLMAELRYAIEKQVEARAFNSMTGLTAASTGGTLHAGVLAAEAAVKGSLAGYVFNAAGTSKAKQSKVGTDQTMVWSNGMVNGYPAKRSVLSPANYGYALAPGSIGKAYWADFGIEIVTDSTLAREGKVMIIASALADSGCLDNNKVAIIKNVSSHT